MIAVAERLTLTSFALWAGDYLFLNSLFEENLSNDSQADERVNVSQLFQEIGKENFDWFTENQRYLTDGPLKKQYLILETDNLRATVWKVTDFEYCMRGYLKKLEGEDVLLKGVSKLQSRITKDHNPDEGFGQELTFGRKKIASSESTRWA